VAAFAHEPVLIDEVLEHLAHRDHGVYFDGTLGGGGHSARLLERLPGATLIGVDRDPDALAAARETLAPFGDRVRLVHGTYAEVAAILGGTRVDGLLLDLGVSSWQLDTPERGFSFGKPGPLDMRMDPTRGETARELIESRTADELAALIRDLGEERHARAIARKIKDAAPRDTAELAAAITTVIAYRPDRMHPATRTFQALRIAVNDELAQLDAFLDAFPDVLAPGGRCAIISFHSLEDRRVKQRFRDLAWTSSLPPRLAADAGERLEPVCTPVTKKAIVAGDPEIARNPRARSARLRVCERTAAPHVPAISRAAGPRRGS